MVNFGWEAQIRVGPSDWSNIEKVRKNFIMKTFSNLLVPLGFELPSKSSPYKGPIRIVLAALLAWQIDSLRVGVCYVRVAFPSVCRETVGTEVLQQLRAQPPKPTSAGGPWATQATFQHRWACLCGVWHPFPGQTAVRR